MGRQCDDIKPEEVRNILKHVFDGLGPKKRVLAIPPDYTRLNSYAGPITEMVYDYFGDRLTDVMPALGTGQVQGSRLAQRCRQGGDSAGRIRGESF